MIADTMPKMVNCDPIIKITKATANSSINVSDICIISYGNIGNNAQLSLIVDPANVGRTFCTSDLGVMKRLVV